VRTSKTPDCLEIKTGVLQLAASKGAIPNGSETEGITYKSADEKVSSIWAPLRKPGKRKCDSILSSMTRLFILSSMSPAPVRTKITSGTQGITFAADSTN